MSWFKPQPKRLPKRLPRRQPKKVLQLGFFYPENARGLWLLDTGEGDTAYDSSDNGNDGTIYGANWTDGKVGEALDFDGVDDYVKVSNSSSLQIGTEITIMAWVKGRNFEVNDRIVQKYEWGAERGYNIHLAPDGLFNFVLGDGGRYPLVSTKTLSTDKWEFITATYNGSTKKLYLNGEEVGTNTINIDPAASTLDLGIAAEQDGSSNFFNGIIDEVRIYDRALSEAEVSLLYEISKCTEEWNL